MLAGDSSQGSILQGTPQLNCGEYHKMECTGKKLNIKNTVLQLWKKDLYIIYRNIDSLATQITFTKINI